MDYGFLFLVGAGFGAGLIAGLLGLGGGILLMPVLRFVFGLDPSLAAGTCVVGVFCTTLAGSATHYKLGHIHVPSLMPVMISGAVASALASLVFVRVAVHAEWIDFGVGLVFFCVAVRMVRAGLRHRAGREPFSSADNQVKGTLVQKAAIGAVAGTVPGLFGIGTGVILVPAFTIGLGAQIKVAIGSSLACFTVYSLVSATFKWVQGFVDLGMAVPICAGAVLGSSLGARINKRFPPSALKVVFGVVFLYIGLKFVLSAWGIRI